MYQTTVLDTIPLWAIFAGTIILIVIATEIGLFFGKRRIARMPEGENLHLGSAVGATMGLLAFILAFTFSMGTDRLDAKRALVLQQANAISTALLRTELLPEPHRLQSQRLLTDYLDQILTMDEIKQRYGRYSKGQEFADNVLTELNKAKQIESELWQVAVAANKISPTPGTALFVGSINEMIDLLQTRFTTSFQERMLPIFWVILFCLAVMAIGLAGYDAGVSRSQRSWAQWVVAIAFAAVMFLVVALDRPQSSTTADLPLTELKAELEASRE